jgi:hypothetical protein
MTKQLNTHQLDRLAEIKEEILDLLSEALDLVRGTPEEQRANHWFATFCTALDSRQRLHNHHAGDHRCLERRCRRIVFRPVGLGWHSRPFRLLVALAPQ